MSDVPGEAWGFGAGWLSFEHPGLGTVRARFTEIDQHWRLTELYIDGNDLPIQTGALRRLSLGELEAFIEQFPYRRLLPGLQADVVADGEPAHRVVDLRRQFTEDDAQARRLKLRMRKRFGDHADDPLGPQPTLAAPVDGLTDAFLGDVARSYGWAVAHGRPPAKELARQAGVSQRTVQAWVYKARKRGLMAPAKTRGRIV